MRCLLTLLTTLLGLTAAQAYVPLVREGVEWIYYEERLLVDYEEQEDDMVFHRFYGIDFEGDTLIGENTFKRCFRYELPDFPQDSLKPNRNGNIPLWRDFSLLYTSHDYPVAYVTERDGRVFCFDLYHNKVDYYAPYAWEDEWVWRHSNKPYDVTPPFVIYEFVDYALSIYWDDYDGYQELDPVNIEGQLCKRFRFDSPFDHEAMIVESVGFDSRQVSDLLMPYRDFCDCLRDESTASLVCVRNKADGRIIYKGRGFEYWPFASEPADVNADAVVDVTDLGLVIDAALDLNALPEADVNGDGTVDVADINAVITVMLGQ